MFREAERHLQRVAILAGAGPHNGWSRRAAASCGPGVPSIAVTEGQSGGPVPELLGSLAPPGSPPPDPSGLAGVRCLPGVNGRRKLHTLEAARRRERSDRSGGCPRAPGGDHDPVSPLRACSAERARGGPWRPRTRVHRGATGPLRCLRPPWRALPLPVDVTRRSRGERGRAPAPRSRSSPVLRIRRHARPPVLRPSPVALLERGAGRVRQGKRPYRVTRDWTIRCPRLRLRRVRSLAANRDRQAGLPGGATVSLWRLSGSGPGGSRASGPASPECGLMGRRAAGSARAPGPLPGPVAGTGRQKTALHSRGE